MCKLREMRSELGLFTRNQGRGSGEKQNGEQQGSIQRHGQGYKPLLCVVPD
jgi:hypothetical protein